MVTYAMRVKVDSGGSPVGDVVHDGLPKLSAQVLGLAEHVLDGLIQALAWLLAAHLM